MAWDQFGIGGFLAVQYAFQPFLTKWYVSPDAIGSSVVLVCELLKLVSCLVIIAASSLRKNGGSNGSVDDSRRWSPVDALWYGGPLALSYTAQNLLTQVAYQNLDGMTFNVINQTKTLFNALFVFLFMGDSQTPSQLVALGCIFGASVLVSVGDSASSGKGASAMEDFWLGATCCMLASGLSGLGSAVTELILVRMKRNTLVFSAELSALGAVSIGLNLLFNLNGDGERMRDRGLFAAWSVNTWTPVVANSLGGIAVGAVTKYFGSVRKGFAITVGLVLSAVLRVLVTGRPITACVAAAVPLASGGIILHMSQKRRRAAESQTKKGD